jgi:hypothetical protein
MWSDFGTASIAGEGPLAAPLRSARTSINPCFCAESGPTSVAGGTAGGRPTATFTAATRAVRLTSIKAQTVAPHLAKRQA